MRYIIIEDFSTDHPSLVLDVNTQKPRIFTDDFVALGQSELYTDAIVVPLSKELMTWTDDEKWPDLPTSETTVYL